MRQNKSNRARPASNHSSTRKSLIVRKPTTGSRPYSDSKPYASKRPSSADSRPYSDSKPFGIKRSTADSRPYADAKKPFLVKDSKPFGVKRSSSPSSPSSKAKQFNSPNHFSTPKPFTPVASKKPAIGAKPFAHKKPNAFKAKKTFTDTEAFTDTETFTDAEAQSHIETKPHAKTKPQFSTKSKSAAAAAASAESKPKAEKKPKPPKKLDPDKCEKCIKLHALCICPEIKSLETDLHVLILQHPQEPDEDLGSARLAHLSLKNSTLKIGLSWANLTKALGREAQPAKWTVLHLGSGIKGVPTTSNLQFVSKQGAPIDPPEALEGIVVLDGTWSQSKALWWRNPWLLKLKRSILMPQEKSLYRELRKEPRQECLSTIESISETLDALGEPDETKAQLNAVFKSLLGKYRELKKTRKKQTP